MTSVSDHESASERGTTWLSGPGLPSLAQVKQQAAARMHMGNALRSSETPSTKPAGGQPPEGRPAPLSGMTILLTENVPRPPRRPNTDKAHTQTTTATHRRLRAPWEKTLLGPLDSFQHDCGGCGSETGTGLRRRNEQSEARGRRRRLDDR